MDTAERLLRELRLDLLSVKDSPRAEVMIRKIERYFSSIESKAPAARQEVDKDHQICEHGRNAYNDDCGMCELAGTDWAISESKESAAGQETEHTAYHWWCPKCLREVDWRGDSNEISVGMTAGQGLHILCKTKLELRKGSSQLAAAPPAPPVQSETLEEPQHIMFEGCDCVVMSPEDYEGLRSLLAQREEDAARYRWLRNVSLLSSKIMDEGFYGERLDDEIDKAVKAEAELERMKK